VSKPNIYACLILLAIIALVGCQQPQSLPQSTVPQVIPANAKLICLFFDDGWQDQYVNALPILLQYNFNATFAIIASEIGHGEGVTLYMGKKEIMDLASRGMDIASHSITHPDLTGKMTNSPSYKELAGAKESRELTDKILSYEVIDSKKHLEKLGIGVRTFVYPYYACDDRVTGYVKKAGYICARGGGTTEWQYSLRTNDADSRYYVPSYAIVREDLEQFKVAVSGASSYSVVCLTYHHVSDVGPVETTTPVINFKEQMQYLKESGFLVVLLPDLF